MACRSINKAEDARKALLARIPDADVTILQLDLSDLQSVRSFVEKFAETIGTLDILINNAGVVTAELMRNDAGHELHMATNYLGAFALTGLLLPYFSKDNFAKDSTPRIINVGSLAHRFGKFDFDDPHWEKTDFHNWKAYARSKIATAAFSMELNRRLKATGSNITALGAHPGFAATEMGTKHGARKQAEGGFGGWYQKKMMGFIGTPAQAAEPTVYAASANNIEGGDYYGPSGFMEVRGKTGKAKMKGIARDVDFGKKIWELSEAQTGVRFLSGV